MIDLTSEISIQTTRSGGKGGQNVNKVETAVIASFNIHASQLLNDEQKSLLQHRLQHRLTKEGAVQLKVQTHRTQLRNKEEAIRKIHELVGNALQKKKIRIATRPSKASREKRTVEKKKHSERKADRRWNRYNG